MATANAVLFGAGVILVCVTYAAAQWEAWPPPPIWEDKPRMGMYLSTSSSIFKLLHRCMYMELLSYFCIAVLYTDSL
jgi:hypothetical protein